MARIPPSTPVSCDVTKSPKAKDLYAEIVIVAIGFVLRTAWALLIPVIPVSDSQAYDALARMLVGHGVYGWTPAQPSAY